jgi:O-antigen/teichoic acid export membrane protein
MPRFIRHISDSALQFLINQVFGLSLFYILSKALDKDRFGELNWTLAVFMTAFGVLGAGLDQLTVRKIAAGDPPGRVLSLYRTHVWVTGVLFYALLLGGSYLAPAFFLRHSLLLWIGIAKTGLFFSTPYKQLAAGKEQFRVLLRMSVGSTVIKGGAVLVCFLLHVLTMPVLLAIFIAGDLVELGLCSYLGKGLLGMRLPLLRIDGIAWMALLRESLPQVGVVLFSAAMARFDWIFIGLFCPAARLAEYSFAYKAFELSSLPLLILAPLLVPAFTRLAAKDAKDGPGNADIGGRMEELQDLIRGEMVLACGTAMLLNIAWSPLVDAITAGRYGAVNARTIFLLSCCLPLLYLNNFLWSLHFARGRLKMIFFVFALSFALNAAGDIWLIPLYGNEGAASAYLLSLGLQTILYLLQTRETVLRWSWVTLVMAVVSAAFCGYLSCRLWTDVIARSAGAFGLYLFVLIVTLQVRQKDYRYFPGGRQPFKRKPRME